MEGNTEVGERRAGDVLGGFTGEPWVSLSSSWRVIHLDLSALPAMAVSQGLHCPPGVYGSCLCGTQRQHISCKDFVGQRLTVRTVDLSPFLFLCRPCSQPLPSLNSTKAAAVAVTNDPNSYRVTSLEPTTLPRITPSPQRPTDQRPQNCFHLGHVISPNTAGFSALPAKFPDKSLS